MIRPATLLPLALAALAAIGCTPERTDYRAYVAHMPRSILVLPPINNTVNIQAPDAFLSTVTRPLVECGYYVYPVAVIDRLFKDNGVPSPGDMHQVSLQRMADVIGPDAVLYITIRQWTTTYILIDSTTSVTLDYRLVDVKTGAVLWQRVGKYAESSSAGSAGNPITMAIAAGIHAAGSAASQGEYERGVARSANYLTFNDPNHGLLKGFRHPDYAKDQERVRRLIQEK